MKARTWIIVIGAVAIVGVVAFLALPALRGRLGLQAGANGGQAIETGTVTSQTAVTVVESSGPVEPQQQATLGWKTSGTVAAVLVQVGDVVQPGDILMTIDLSSAPANVVQAQSDLLAAQQALDDLYEPPTALAIANAEKAIVDAQDALDTAERSLNALLNPDLEWLQEQVDAKAQALLTAQQNAEKTDLGNLTAALEAAQKDLETKTNQLNDARTAQEQCPGCTTLFINATGRRMSLEDAEQQYQDAVDALRVAELNLAQANQSNQDAIEAAQDALDTAEANLRAAQDEPDALELALRQATYDRAVAALADAEDKLDELQTGPETADVAAAEMRITTLETTLDSVNLRATFAGEVLAVLAQPGDPVTQGTPAVRLANRDQLHVDVSVDETDVSQITVGDPVSVTLDALSELSLPGTVAAIETFGETVQGLVRYTVRVDLIESDPRLYLSMTANATIVTEVEENALAVPLDAIQFDEAGEYVNRVLAGSVLERVNVITGQTDGDLVFVSGDLSVGDQVQIIAPEVEQGLPFGPGG